MNDTSYQFLKDLLEMFSDVTQFSPLESVEESVFQRNGNRLWSWDATKDPRPQVVKR